MTRDPELTVEDVEEAWKGVALRIDNCMPLEKEQRWSSWQRQCLKFPPATSCSGVYRGDFIATRNTSQQELKKSLNVKRLSHQAVFA